MSGIRLSPFASVTGSALAAALVASVPAAAARSPLALKLTGASTKRLTVCGHVRRTAVVEPGTARLTLSITHRRARGTAGGAALGGVASDRCVGSSWTPSLRQRLGGDLTTWSLDVSTWTPGDYRLRIAVKQGSTGRPPHTRIVYLRVPFSSQTQSGPSGAGRTADTVDLPVSFVVHNVNNSALSCSSDGASYRLSGHLVAPLSALQATAFRRSVTLYLHEFSYGQWFWRFPQAAYDYAQAQAQAGRASVVIDRLGYGASPRPPGTQTCLGAQADMAHQIVSQLRAGSYSSPAGPGVAFGRVAIGGHSVGGGIAELEAYSFRDVDALVLLAWASQGYSPHATEDGVQQGLACGHGGQPSGPAGPPGYAYYNTSSDDFRALSFHDTDPAVLATALSLRAPDPCGDVQSLVPVIATSNVHSREISVPVLLVYGLGDAVYQQPSTGQQQTQMYGGSSDVTTIYIDGAGHALTLERSAPQMRAQVADWLGRHGF